MMKLRQFTKTELIELIESVVSDAPQGDYYVKRAVNKLKHKKEQQKIEEAERKQNAYFAKLKEYDALLSPYRGKPFTSIPADVLSKAEALSKELEKEKVKMVRTWESL